MKKIILLLSVVFFFALSGNAQEIKKSAVDKAQNEVKDIKQGYEVIEIQTNGTCEKCQERIVSNAPFWKGVKDCRYDLATSKVRVVYDPNLTTPHRIREAISKIGYDADDVKADAEARAKLPACCKAAKTNDAPHSGCGHACPHSKAGQCNHTKHANQNCPKTAQPSNIEMKSEKR